MRSFKIAFYKSEQGELTKIREFFRLANTVDELVSNPPEEFMDMLTEFVPLQGWVEMEPDKASVFVIFTPREGKIMDAEREEFSRWLENIKPADFKGAC